QVAEANQKQYAALSDYSRIVAPFSGVVTARYADTGALIAAGTSSRTQSMPVVRLAEISKLRLVLPIPESVAAQIHLGDPVEARVQALNQDFVGKVSRFADSLDRQTSPQTPRKREGKLMSGFSIKYPFFIIVACLVVTIVGTVTLVRMPVDLFPPINIPVVVVATFYSGMPPQQIETNITNPFERFFTLASGVDHIESRSLPGVSLIKIYFQPGTNADADLSTVSNLAMADLRRLPPGTLPPVVLKFDASSLPVCLITLKGQGLNETDLQDLGRYTVG